MHSHPYTPSDGHQTNLDRIESVFDRQELRRICGMAEKSFAKAFGLTRNRVAQKAPADWYAFRDNGSSVLAVAHLDTVVRPDQRQCEYIKTAGGEIVYSGALDDRLGAYAVLDMLPRLGVNVDVLLTVGEETGESTAAFFEPPKNYNWVIEFDRGGTDVVMYQYDDIDTSALVESTGARVGNGTFSDIAYLEHLGVKAFNWGVGYQDYHSVRSHAYLDDFFLMLDYFLDFHFENANTALPHVETVWTDWTPDDHSRIADEWTDYYKRYDTYNYPSERERHDYAAHDFGGHDVGEPVPGDIPPY